MCTGWRAACPGPRGRDVAHDGQGRVPRQWWCGDCRHDTTRHDAVRWSWPDPSGCTAHAGRTAQTNGTGQARGTGQEGGMKMSRIIISPDSFKGTISGEDSAAALGAGWGRVRPDDEVMALPQADGGEGTCAVIADAVPALGGCPLPSRSPDPMDVPRPAAGSCCPPARRSWNWRSPRASRSWRPRTRAGTPVAWGRCCGQRSRQVPTESRWAWAVRRPPMAAWGPCGRLGVRFLTADGTEIGDGEPAWLTWRPSIARRWWPRQQVACACCAMCAAP